MPRLLRRAGPVGLALTLADAWKKLPPKQRRAILDQAKKHGPTIVAKAREHGPRVVKALKKRPL